MSIDGSQEDTQRKVKMCNESYIKDRKSIEYLLKKGNIIK